MGLISSGQRGLSIRRSKGIKPVHPKKLHVNCQSPLKSSTISTLAPLDQIADAPERTSPSRSCSGGSICTLEQVFIKSYCTNYCQFHTCQYMYIMRHLRCVVSPPIKIHRKKFIKPIMGHNGLNMEYYWEYQSSH